MDEPWRLDPLAPWLSARDGTSANGAVERWVYQYEEAATCEELPHVLTPLVSKEAGGVHGTGHITAGLGDHTPNDILTRAPLYSLTASCMLMAPHAPLRGKHRHMPAPTLFSLQGKGWEWNDGITYNFEQYDMLVIPPYNVHQHGCDPELGGQIYHPTATRVAYVLGSLGSREQHTFRENASFPIGTEPLKDDAGELVGYRIKKGVLGLTEDLDVILGRSEPQVEDFFEARREAGPFKGTVSSTYDRYLKTFHDEAEFCRNADHVIRDADQQWEWTRQGKMKWYIHPEFECAAKDKWVFMQEIPAGSRSGMHSHAAEELIYVLEGSGYDLHDGQRWNWQAGEWIAIPSFTVHQHLAAGNSRAVLLSTMPRTYTNYQLGGIVQIEDCPEWPDFADGV